MIKWLMLLYMQFTGGEDKVYDDTIHAVRMLKFEMILYMQKVMILHIQFRI